MNNKEMKLLEAIAEKEGGVWQEMLDKAKSDHSDKEEAYWELLIALRELDDAILNLINVLRRD